MAAGWRGAGLLEEQEGTSGTRTSGTLLRKTRALLLHDDHLDDLRARARANPVGGAVEGDPTKFHGPGGGVGQRCSDAWEFDDSDLKGWTSYLISRPVNAPSREQVGARLSRLCVDWRQTVSGGGEERGRGKEEREYNPSYRRNVDPGRLAKTMMTLGLEDAIDGLSDDEDMFFPTRRPDSISRQHRSSIGSRLSTRPMSQAPHSLRAQPGLLRPPPSGTLAWAKSHVVHAPSLPETEWRRGGPEQLGISHVWSNVYDDDRLLADLDHRYSQPVGGPSLPSSINALGSHQDGASRAHDAPSSDAGSGQEAQLGAWTERWSLTDSLQRAWESALGVAGGSVSAGRNPDEFRGDGQRLQRQRESTSQQGHRQSEQLKEALDSGHGAAWSTQQGQEWRADVGRRPASHTVSTISGTSVGVCGGGRARERSTGYEAASGPKSSWSRFSNSDYRSLGQSGYGGFGL